MKRLTPVPTSPAAKEWQKGMKVGSVHPDPCATFVSCRVLTPSLMRDAAHVAEQHPSATSKSPRQAGGKQTYSSICVENILKWIRGKNGKGVLRFDDKQPLLLSSDI